MRDQGRGDKDRYKQGKSKGERREQNFETHYRSVQGKTSFLM